MRTKLATLFVLLASLSCCHGCPKRKRVQLECSQWDIGRVTKPVLEVIKKMEESKPDEEPHIKLLKRFRKPCVKKGVDFPTVIEILDIYKTHVFSKLSNNEEFMANVGRIKDTLEHCLYRLSGNQPAWSKKNVRNLKNIDELRKTFEKLDEAGLYKAVLEFKAVLLWVGMFQGK